MGRKTCLGNRTSLHGCLKIRTTPFPLAKAPETARRLVDRDVDPGPRGYPPSCTLALCSLSGSPARARPAVPLPHRPTRSTAQSWVRRPVSREGGWAVAKGWDHPAPWGPSFRRNLPQVCTGLPHTLWTLVPPASDSLLSPPGPGPPGGCGKVSAL